VFAVTKAVRLVAATRTQSWDVVLIDARPMPSRPTIGGDLNLTQLASGAGVLGTTYRAHPECGGHQF
jgi:hypothetical protein